MDPLKVIDFSYYKFPKICFRRNETSALTIDVDAGKITIVVNGFIVYENLTVNSLRNMTSRLPRSVKSSIILGKTYLAELKMYYQYKFESIWQ